ncbi:MAG: AbrB family transcriptional regulator [Thermomicrobiales bacterium]
MAQLLTPRNVIAWGICAASGWLGTWIGVPVAWLVCPMIVAVLLRLGNLPPGPHPQWVFNGVQAVIGVVLGATFSLDALRPLASDAIPVAVSVFAVLFASIVAGRALTRFARIAPTTAQIGSIPGGAAGMIALSEDLGADSRLVAFMQYFRVVLVVVSISVLANWVHGDDELSAIRLATVAPDTDWRNTVLAIAVGGTGLWLGLRLRIPAGSMLGPLMIAAAVSSLNWEPIVLPAAVLPIAYLLLGTRIGARFDRELLRRIRGIIWHLFAFVVVLILGCAVLGYGLHLVTDIDLLTALLATSPGGMDAATIAALETGANTPIVVAIQLIRMLVMIIVGPILVRKLIRPETIPG